MSEAAVPGDTIDLWELRYMTSVPIPVWKEPIISIPEDCYFVLGDNSDNSWDCRYWEDPYVRQRDIRAKIWIPNLADQKKEVTMSKVKSKTLPSHWNRAVSCFRQNLSLRII